MTTWEIYWIFVVPTIIIYTLWEYGFFDKQYDKHLIWKIIFWTIFTVMWALRIFVWIFILMLGASTINSARKKYWDNK